jgi:hypothetical protein
MDASIAASHPEAVCCKHADIGCPAQFFLVEELERHYKEEAQEHLELALRALSVERSMKEHLQEAMTNAQSRCRKNEKEILSLRSKITKLQTDIAKVRSKLAEWSQLSSSELQIRRIISSFLGEESDESLDDDSSSRSKSATIRDLNLLVENLRSQLAAKEKQFPSPKPKTESPSLVPTLSSSPLQPFSLNSGGFFKLPLPLPKNVPHPLPIFAFTKSRSASEPADGAATGLTTIKRLASQLEQAIRAELRRNGSAGKPEAPASSSRSPNAANFCPYKIWQKVKLSVKENLRKSQ